MLHSLNLRLPSKVIATGWIMAEDGKKMSKSLNNVIDPNEIIDLYGNDIFKYYIFKEFSIADDNNFSVKKMLELYNSDLANIFGNLVSRTIGMLKLYTDSVILRPVCAKSEYTETLLSAETKLLDSIEAAINNFDIKKVICMIVDYAKDLNKYVDDTKP
jgi:methionyl-tRNA synthetase